MSVRRLLLALLILPVAVPPLRAQVGSLILPPGYDPSRSHPVVILLPFTGGGPGRLLEDWGARAGRPGPNTWETSGHKLAAMIEHIYPGGAGREEFAVILVCGSGREEDYATEDAWSATIVRCEDEILAKLDEHAARYSLDTTRVVLAGYSMGGDLAWALALRNPRRFLGAVVMGSRASYRTTASRMAALAKRGARIVFTLGDQEESVRLDGARAAAGLLEHHGIAHRLVLIPGGGHVPAPLTEFGQALRFVLGEPPSRRAPGNAGRWRTVTAGASHACALAADSTAYCWGNNGAEGRLGDGTTDSRPYPAPVAGGYRFRSISTTADHTCGVARDRRVLCWGDNTGFKLGDNTDTSRTRPVHSGPHDFAVVGAGANRTCAVHVIGPLYCWGTDSVGMLGTLRASRSRYPAPVTRSQRIQALAIGYGYSCALGVDSLAYCWGPGFYSSGITVVNNLLRVSWTLRFTAITTGAGFGCGLTAEGAAYCWGYDRGGNLGAGRRATDSYAPVPVAGGLRFLGIDAGADHTCGVTTDHEAYCWGHNDHGQLGDGTRMLRNVPTRVTGGLRFASVGAGANFSCGVTTAGGLWCWGFNSAGELGGPTEFENGAPLAIPNPRATPRLRE